MNTGTLPAPREAIPPKGSDSPAGEGFQILEGEWFYKIPDYNRIPPFFISLVSPDDHWFFISTTGGLTCGRQCSDIALFPYEPEDKIRENHNHTGPVTWLRLHRQGESILWQPFSDETLRRFDVTRNLYKNAVGNLLIFEEINHDLEVTFCYRWATSGNYGFSRRVSLTNASATAHRIEILDGVRNILPAGITQRVQMEFSCLTNAYKSSERIGNTSLAVYSLSSGITDQAVPMESLMATTAWSRGLPEARILLGESAIGDFMAGRQPQAAVRLRGQRGAYLLQSSPTLEPGQTLQWWMAFDVNQSQIRVNKLQRLLTSGTETELVKLEQDVREGTEKLKRLAAASDGLQLTQDHSVSHHHFTNTLFNLMRGGIFSGHYEISSTDFISFVRNSNRALFLEQENFLKSLPGQISHSSLKKRVESQHSADLIRVFLEYLPLTFSRRHGDPSRPWNHFSIRIADEAGNPVLDYQGNWRDIFQNWEALALSYPDWLPHMISRFVNASTADGYNPYRLMRGGLEWEEPTPEDPWAGIGYWGDHQIIYLLKLLEWAKAFDPAGLQNMLYQEVHTYAEVPYEIAPYEQLKKNPRLSITFNKELNQRIKERVRQTGPDGKLLHGKNGLHRVNLTEKILVPVLTKLSNLIPGGGIWMNTQRPEWNDANNALVGYGVSVVTLCYLRRHLVFLIDLFQDLENEKLSLSREVAAFSNSLLSILRPADVAVCSKDPAKRRTLTDQLGEAGSCYREKLYRHGLSSSDAHPVREILELFWTALPLLDESIRINRRPDGLYHSYNLLSFRDGLLDIRHLDEMLEGQVAVLSSGLLSDEECVGLLDALGQSRLYRKDQNSYILYPDKELPGFLEKNTFSPETLKKSRLLETMLESCDTRLISGDINGLFRFHPDFSNSGVLKEQLSKLKNDPDWGALATKEEAGILDLYENVFGHHSFTGRSGTMFAYEGLGSIYWHMVAKLLLAVQENLFKSDKGMSYNKTFSRLSSHYDKIRAGLGFNKNSREYGAFPIDPYSHTPAHAGAQQPGMTGLVKEEILTRFGELGLQVRNGCLAFSSRFLKHSEFLKCGQNFSFYNVDQTLETLSLPIGSLAFTFCQVPVCYRSDLPSGQIQVHTAGKELSVFPGGILDSGTSRQIFGRSGHVRLIEVGILT